MAKIQQAGKYYFVYLPKQYVKLLGWEKGTELVCYPAKEEEKALLIKKMS